VQGTTETIDRAQRLFSYLRELAQLRTRTVRDLAQYDVAIPLGSPPESASYASAFHGQDPEELEAWFEIDRVLLPARPSPDRELTPWIDAPTLGEFRREAPDLVDTEGTAPPWLDATFDDYVNQAWLPWAHEMRRLAPAFGLERGRGAEVPHWSS
jgi:hypothetical protein